MRRPVFETKQAILSRLASESFISGQALADELDISRAAVGKHVQELIELGLDIFSVKGKGYRLAKPLDLIQHQALAESVKGKLPDGARLHLFPVIDSTNQFWLERRDEGAVSGSACFAECQTAGRGRRGRQWQSPLGAALYFSMWWQSDSNLAELMGLSVAIGLAVTRWLNQLEVPAKVKWPNDIYVQGKKLAGILVDLEALPDGRGQAVVGIGLNIELPTVASEQIDQAWTQLKDYLPGTISRTELAAGLYIAVLDALTLFETQGLQACIADWFEYDHFYDQPICLLMGKHQTEGLCKGIDGQGALLVETSGGLKSFFGGEISVRGQDAAG